MRAVGRSGSDLQTLVLDQLLAPVHDGKRPGPTSMRRESGRRLAHSDWPHSGHLAPGMALMPCSRHSNSFSKLVGRTGFEPVTFSVSGRRAPAAPTARDDESLPDSGSGGVRHGELR
jgi:hypothetical protein